MTIDLFHKVSYDCSRVVTENYSTSFSSAIQLLHKDLRVPIYNIYGFVRFADEIVDTFHQHNKIDLLDQFKTETFSAIEKGISLNPILNSFQKTVNQFAIDLQLIHAFFKSMESDLTQNNYDRQGYEEYIYGSAEVVGLMCLYVFCEGDARQYEKLKSHARALGAAFQKVNFLRDIQYDFNDLSRLYFPGCDFHNFTEKDKVKIEEDIALDFKNAYQGILSLPIKARFGVYVAYKYYYSLFKKIRAIHHKEILRQRIRIPNYQKAFIILRASVKNGLRLIE
ncbi:phytoene/squalene synthase family protein [Flavisolibacter ginsengisoli]|jgi:phytoene/squalene synthetase|uniref:Phytoene/squalene synthetase n=1 Tax=Flavisolibacter ginsengisoli DSM 18119 TaxID=1121884 RepID=A0A1M4VIP8_9BACT|nr:phytoene/squalene synthase family protein [Flavisolibacter ginsengisoli]SHE68677.1 Phytoene/squalene synthetase [Flavisolibacter ginsengisoli DSM 18119]